MLQKSLLMVLFSIRGGWVIIPFCISIKRTFNDKAGSWGRGHKMSVEEKRCSFFCQDGKKVQKRYNWKSSHQFDGIIIFSSGIRAVSFWVEVKMWSTKHLKMKSLAGRKIKKTSRISQVNKMSGEAWYVT